MAYPETLPPSNRTVGSADPPGDHNVLTTAVGNIDTRLNLVETTNSRLASDTLTTGFSTIPRMFALMGASNVTLSTGETHYDYFTAPISLSCGTIRIGIETARAGGTVTLAKVAIFNATNAGDATITSAVVSDITMFDVAGDKDLSLGGTPFPFVGGNRYGVGILGIQGTAWTTAPTLAGTRNAPSLNTIGFRPPVLMSRRTGQTDLVSSTAAQVIAASGRSYVEFF